MLNVGLTGGIACGKSTVAQMFVRLGGHLIDFDKLAHEVQKPDWPAWQDVVNYFGREILRPDQNIDRNKLAAVVFNQPDKLQKLNDIIHPRVYEAWRSRLEKIKKHHPHAIVFADVPLLFEGRMQHLFDLTILVMVAPEEQVNRLMNRSDLCRAEAELRLSCQMPIHDKMNLADIVIDNQCVVEETEKKVTEVWQNLLEREKHQKH
ncbi:MAG: Dephospho-CoA kinase [Deltaproteobacteria bacterium ADurb.Bin151]|jgi:dephospho-CoA kinase|nr:MAG: Dephospho-CoA kinase [Deltaproteobacteria bacterium ADurb.Bin151]HRY35033.1 dephospho-CoA kinase [Smithellaceae bacterium]